jgi:thioredoxin-related protein
MVRFLSHACLSFALALSCLATISSARGAELIMFEQAGCPYCEAFDREIAPIYSRTPIGRLAPLRRVDIYRPVPDDLNFLRVERVTPVFVLVDRGREIGRIRGYPGEANFWGLIEDLVSEIAPPDDTTHTDISSETAVASSP